MTTPKETFLEAAASIDWIIADKTPALADMAEGLFDHAGRGSDPWSMVMTRVRDAVLCAEGGGSVAAVKAWLVEAATRANAKGIALPGVS
jgi:hypothetical protein